MAANKAPRLRSESERAAEVAGTPIATVFGSHAELASAPAAAREQNLEALERAADGIRPSWHGAELEARAPRAELPVPAIIPAPLPAPAPLPTFASFPIERAPQYSADSTVRTAALLPERLAHLLLTQPPVARASNWLRARPWALWSLAGGTVLLLLLLFWPSSEPAPLAQGQKSAPADAVRRVPGPPALPTPPRPSAPEPGAPAAAASPRAAEQAAKSAPPAAVPNAKRRDKRAARTAPKAVSGKARGSVREPKKPSPPAR